MLCDRKDTHDRGPNCQAMQLHAAQHDISYTPFYELTYSQIYQECLYFKIWEHLREHLVVKMRGSGVPDVRRIPQSACTW